MIKDKKAKMIKVVKRDGSLEDLDVSQIDHKAENACKDLQGVSAQELRMDGIVSLSDNITTTEIQETLVRTAVAKISAATPNWTFVAARLELNTLYHKVGKLMGSERGQPYPKLRQYIEVCVASKKYGDFHQNYDLEDLDKAIKIERDNQFGYLGFRTYHDRYAFRVDGNVVELPQHLFMGVAMFLAQKEKDAQKWAKIFYEELSTFRIMTATPTLSNSRKKIPQIFSCFVGGSDDSLDGIFDGYKEKALLSKYGGGWGWDWSQLRSLGSSIDGNKGAAKGVVPFIKIDNGVAIAVDQLSTRKGAIAPYLADWSKDIKKFMQMREKGAEERYLAMDLFPALWVSDLFMTRVKEGSTWSLFDALDVPHFNELYGEEFEKAYIEAENNPDIKKDIIIAKDLWAQFIKAVFVDGVPFLCFKDTINKDNKLFGIIRSSNLCTEITQPTEPDRNYIRMKTPLSNVFVPEFQEVETVAGKKKAKDVEIGDIVRCGGEDGIVASTEKKRIEGRTAVCVLGSVNLSKTAHLPKEKFQYTVSVGVRMLDNAIDVNQYITLKTERSAKQTRAVGLGVMGETEHLAQNHIVFGSKEHEEEIHRIYQSFQEASIKASEDLAEEKGVFPDFEKSSFTKKRRNGFLNAVAPTSSISILVGTTQSIEPVYAREWYEENLSGVIPTTAPNIAPDNYKYYRPAYNVDQKDIIKMNAIRQKYIDQAISMNLFVKPNDITHASQISDLYMMAWQEGLKSVYYLRSKAPEDDDVMPTENREMECDGCQ